MDYDTVAFTQYVLDVFDAAQKVKTYPHSSQRLAVRLATLEKALLLEAKASTGIADAIKQLMIQIICFMQGLDKREPVTEFMQHSNTITEFKQLTEKLSYITENLKVPWTDEQCANEDLNDSRDDFDQVQMLNTETMDDLEKADEINKHLQFEQPVELRAFNEIDYNVLRRGSHWQSGIGSFGTVFKSRWNDKDVAIKVANCRTVDVTTLTALRKAVRGHATPEVVHERIIAFYGACTLAPCYALVMEYAPYGLLHNLLHGKNSISARTQLTLTVRVQMLLDIAEALQHLHSHNIVHGDVKSSNALLFENNRVKISDCGLAYVNKAMLEATKRDTQSGGDFGFAIINKSVLKTPERLFEAPTGYKAPELVLNDSAKSTRSDVYSFSMIMYEVATDEMPYGGMTQQQINEVVKRGVRPPVTEANTNDDCMILVPLMEQCWHHNSRKRPTCSTVISSLNETADEIIRKREAEAAAALAAMIDAHQDELIERHQHRHSIKASMNDSVHDDTAPSSTITKGNWSINIRSTLTSTLLFGEKCIAALSEVLYDVQLAKHPLRSFDMMLIT
jgi:serine/threonine protein kinase